MMTRCIRVPKREGERVRADLLSEGILDTTRKIGSDELFLFIPILTDRYGSYEAADVDLEIIEQTPADYKEVLDIPEEFRRELPTSFDIIGDVAIIKIPDVLVPYKDRIGGAMMSVNSSIRTVMMDSGVKGDLRIRELEQIAGEGSSETVHKEFGVRMITDPSKVYFNPRLATERARVASLVKDGETIIDMFAGVAPFGLVISKRARPKIIYSIDINPDAERFARRNTEINRIENIISITGDAAEVMIGLPEADRVIMNLPQTADSFLANALSKTRVGGTIHLHKVIERAELDDLISKIKEGAGSLGFGISVGCISELKTYSPTMSVYVLDIRREV
ncbi:MAG: class I SAM-dependent methyltransferase family protein [Methanomassiliicoccaceae archaeon]|nr:class I SAM-dependent methyltransferase family protein [Methanomassiliicoccaceae archaeon]MCL2145608.1 class I SAM-dependent methyltransferase family protein [Methanomassiliicoccaceae archaeon]